MKRFAIITIAVLWTAASVPCASVIDNWPFFGIAAEYGVRRGYFDFGNGRTQELQKVNLPAAGVLLGKRWRLTRHLRLQAAGAIGYGSVVDDTLPRLDGLYDATLLQTRFFIGGILADLQRSFNVSPDGALFLHGGAGAHIVNVEESESPIGDGPRVVDGYPENHLMYSGSVHGGLGFEIVVSPRFGFALVYSLRYWRPVHYPMARDLFPFSPIDYQERFLSHVIHLLFLVKRY